MGIKRNWQCYIGFGALVALRIIKYWYDERETRY